MKVATRPKNAALRKAFVFVLAILLPPAAAQPTAAQDAADTNIVTDARVVGDTDRTRFIADLSDDVDISVFLLADPYRVVIDLPEVRFQLAEGTGGSGRGLVSAYRYGLIARGQSRIVLDLTDPVAVDEAFVLAPVDDQPARLVVDLVPTTREAFLDEAAEFREQVATADEPALEPSLIDGGGNARPVVVIDPGHGGIDAGAVGADGTLEKNVVLAFATALADALRATGRYQVELTRTGDTFPSLSERVAFARQERADLFLSIHADWLSDGTVRGTAVYTVSERASDEVSAQLAASENRSDILAGVQLADAPSQVTDVLIDLARRETNNFSILFARDLVDRLEDVTTLIRNPHRQAGFAVLTAPDVPSALIELGFLSNAADEEILLSDDWQEQTAAAVADAVDSFFATRIAGFIPP